MPALDLSEFEWKTILRPLRKDDYDAIVEMQKVCFPGMHPWMREQIESQINIFPEGQIAVEIDGQLVATSSSLILQYDPDMAWYDWKKVADDGYIRNHNIRGDTLYGIEIMVHPDFRGMKLARRLYDARKELCRELNLRRMIIGGRIPGYGKHAEQMSARQYVDQVCAKQKFDPVLTAQIANGFALQGLLPNYFPSDEASRGYATFLEWRNLDYMPTTKRRSSHVIEPIRLAVVQYALRTITGFDEFARQCEFFIDTASEYHSDFVLFPELFTTQLLSCTNVTRPGHAARHLAEYTPQYLDLFTEMAVRYDINVIGGSQFVVENGTLFNVSYLFRRDGTLGKQYKIHVTPSERKWWGVAPGSKVEVFDTDCGRVAILICYDIEFPELVRIAANKGAQIIFVPFNTDTRHGYLRIRHCSLARCVENHMYVAVSGCTGNLPFVENSDIHYAQSAIFTPADAEFARDAIAAETNANIETMIIHDVDLEQSRRHKLMGSVQNFNDRRTDLYKVVYQEDGEEHKI
ncbi:bifunctional GNAT family N-acetyltransferase/carbon-nitrogen hydrolase family protein [Rubinisphaera margarita]|uniref:bifunctional GNAT family N-acetyltransferase/carbon-nitrogen hydrolase family protein n=1 Tax=Rubinisphaera margarita TaxID=2909586 RepID=UPI001EE7F161|nr:bifunctional GNAT family N-acetyltransferase/carbon-nitrogen hydrolase family protein [Rubinisphaera margarita]MCG6154538.1 GNAT family N-acetyltransferase [Rubinisphaera margarita]